VTYIIAEPCIDIKDLSCVDVCPVDCIHVFERILIIDPEECIDCFAPSEQLITSQGLRTFGDDAQHLSFSEDRLGDADPRLGAQRRPEDELAFGWAVRSCSEGSAKAGLRDLPVGPLARARLRWWVVEQARDPLW
jgi:ferredoxin